MEAIQKALNQGQHLTADSSLKHTIVFTNLVSILSIFAIAISIPTLAIFGAKTIFIPLILNVAIFGFSIGSNRFGYATAARVGCSVGITLSSFIIASSFVGFGLEENLQSSFFVSLVLPLALFGKDEKKSMVGCSILAALSYFIFNIIPDGIFLNEVVSERFSTIFVKLHNLGFYALLALICYRIYRTLERLQLMSDENLHQRNKMVSLISHDIFGNMSIIQGSLKLIERNFQVRNDPAGKRYYDRAIRAYSAAENMIESVRHIKDFDSTRSDIKKESVSFEECEE